MPNIRLPPVTPGGFLFAAARPRPPIVSNMLTYCIISQLGFAPRYLQISVKGSFKNL